MKIFFTISILILCRTISDAQIFVKQDATGTNDGTSWSNAFTNLQSALDAAIAVSEIWIAAGNYIPQGATPQESHFWLLTPAKLYGGFAGNETTLSERNWVLNQTIINGDKNGDDVPGDLTIKRTDNAHHVLIIDAQAGETVIDGFIFQGGNTRIDAYAPDGSDLYINRWNGGGLYVYKSPITITNSTFRENAGSRGAGIFALGDFPNGIKMSLINSTFQSNKTNYHAGGAFLSEWSDIEVIHCNFLGNSTKYNGGGLYFSNSSGTVTGCAFEGNTAKWGGGLGALHYNSTSPDPINIQVSQSSFTENLASENGGGFMLTNTEKGFSLAIDSCVFTRNSTADSYAGGGLSIQDNGDIYPEEIANTVRINRCEFNENSSYYGGGAYIEATDDSLNVEISDSKFFSNTATDWGGGLYAWMVDLAITDFQLKNNLFDGNSAVNNGGGIILDSYDNNYRQNYTIDSSFFMNNLAGNLGGAIISWIETSDRGAIGSIRNSQFLNNEAIAAGGAIFSLNEKLSIENSIFSGNSTEGSVYPAYNGGGAISLSGPSEAKIRNTFFDHNKSDNEASAIFTYNMANTWLENILYADNIGNSTILNSDSMVLMNNTVVDNTAGIRLNNGSYTEFQNSIFANELSNLFKEDTIAIISRGGNISNDGTMTLDLTGYGQYEDLHNTDPLLNQDRTPQKGSPAIDAGNPEGVTTTHDLAGNPRISGGAIDIGSYESFTVAVKDANWNNDAMAIYPNPLKDLLNFKLVSPSVGETDIRIYNQLGQQVYNSVRNKTGNIGVFQENVMSLAPGKYVLIVDSGDKTYATSIIIQR